jgi:hypothetical protein
MKYTILSLLIEILYLKEFGLPWLVWVLVLAVTIVVGGSIMVAKQYDRETLELIDEFYKARNENKDTEEA